MNRSYLFLLLLALYACEKMEVEEVNHFADFYCSGEIKDTSIHQDFRFFSYRLGDTLSVFNPFYDVWQFHTVLAHAVLPTWGLFTRGRLPLLRVEFFGASSGENTTFFRIEFQPDEWTADEELSKEDLEAYFYPGRSFAFGRERDEVNLVLFLPQDGSWPDLFAHAYFLNEPDGNLLITGVEDYEFEYYTPNNLQAQVRTQRGKRISCTFEGSIARFGHSPLGMRIEDFRTDEALPLRNGEAVFFVAY